MPRRKPRLTPKTHCEICGNTDTKILHRHHIIERTELGTSNDDYNLAIICPNCHHLVHEGDITIIGIYPSTAPGGRTLVFEHNGQKNIPGINEPYIVSKPKVTKL